MYMTVNGNNLFVSSCCFSFLVCLFVSVYYSRVVEDYTKCELQDLQSF